MSTTEMSGRADAHPNVAAGDQLIVVCGAGGFIGGHLVADLLRRGHRRIRAVDIKPLSRWCQRFGASEKAQLDLRLREACLAAIDGAHTVYNLAADMGGMGFIEANRAACMLNVLINTHLLEAARQHAVSRYFFASSACVYNVALQQDTAATALRESDAYPAQPEDGYGWEKLFSERMCRHFEEDFGLACRVARLHNVYGPHGAWRGGREKAPAAICRKVIEAQRSACGDIEIWGTGQQTRSFMHVDDCVHGIQLITASNEPEPLNLGSSELVTINHLVDLAEEFAGIRLQRRYAAYAPRGVNGRNSDNTRIQARLGWAPSITIREGLEPTYRWIASQMETSASSGRAHGKAAEDAD